MKTRIKTPRLVNAQEMNKLHPLTFDYPEKEICELKAGDSVKVCNSKERFWVTVKEIKGDDIIGIVDNDLISVSMDKLKLGDTIGFKKENIYDIW